MSFPELRPHCGADVVMMKRVYVRDTRGRFHGIGWMCPICLKFHNDIEEHERKKVFKSIKNPVPKLVDMEFRGSLIYPISEDEDDF